jgi:predicted SnoaL-like aldol condensation-catalyzing enzyme
MATENRNREIALEFYEQVTNRRDFAAASRFLGPRFVQHRPDVADGPQGLRDFIDRMRSAFPRSQCDIKRSFVDGDFVILQVHVVREPGTRGSNHMDILKLEDGKVVEHWDVNEPISEDAANPNGVF